MHPDPPISDLVLAPVRRRRIDQIAIVDGTLTRPKTIGLASHQLGRTRALARRVASGSGSGRAAFDRAGALPG